jgi:hypothetical protein
MAVDHIGALQGQVANQIVIRRHMSASFLPTSMVRVVLWAAPRSQQPMQPLPDALTRHRVRHQSQPAVLAPNSVRRPSQAREAKALRSKLNGYPRNAQQRPNAVRHQESETRQSQKASCKPQLSLLPFDEGWRYALLHIHRLHFLLVRAAPYAAQLTASPAFSCSGESAMHRWRSALAHALNTPCPQGLGTGPIHDTARRTTPCSVQKRP